MSARELDLALLSLPVEAPEFVAEPLMRYWMQPAVPRSHPSW
jgi:DNA-binding transcriptional LysR family regulator